MASKKRQSKKIEDSSVEETMPDIADAGRDSSTDVSVRNTEEEKPEEHKKEKRQIVFFSSLPSIKKFLLDEESDERAAIEKMVKICINDFALKCAVLIEDSVLIPSSAYTYVTFMERFGFLQQEDSTTEETARSISAKIEDPSVYEKILEACMSRRPWLFDEVAEEDRLDIEWSNYVDKDLLKAEKIAKSKISKMFGVGTFPELKIWYNYSDVANTWQFVYSIAAPKDKLVDKEEKEMKDSEYGNEK